MAGRPILGANVAGSGTILNSAHQLVSDVEDGRAPICVSCRVTALPDGASYVLDTRFVCENPDCDAYGEAIDPQ
jgi:hypothetical protein